VKNEGEAEKRTLNSGSFRGKTVEGPSSPVVGPRRKSRSAGFLSYRYAKCGRKVFKQKARQ
jgi:hypothetical protein